MLMIDRKKMTIHERMKRESKLHELVNVALSGFVHKYGKLDDDDVITLANMWLHQLPQTAVLELLFKTAVLNIKGD